MPAIFESPPSGQAVRLRDDIAGLFEDFSGKNVVAQSLFLTITQFCIPRQLITNAVVRHLCPICP